MLTETIAAVSTASGPGAIGIIRVSGPSALNICSPHIQFSNQTDPVSYLISHPRIALLAKFLTDGKSIDEIVCLFFPSPNSYTGEDLIELHFHGNPLLLKIAIASLFQSGARPAQNGEFTKRSYLSGKMPLSKAEAIGRLIESKSRKELELAQKSVFGEISRLESKLRSDLISLKAECEAEIDFSTEDLTFESLEQRKGRLASLLDLTRRTLEASARAEKAILHSTVVLFGAPNTGKSSLMNLLIGKDRSIISDIPGTTRDYIAEEISLGGIPIRLIDTAGVRATEDIVEKMGIDRSIKELSSANLRLILLDASQVWDPDEFLSLHKEHLKGSIVIANKIDSMHKDWKENSIKELLSAYNAKLLLISCKERIGIEQIIALVQESLSESQNTEDLVLLEERQAYHLKEIFQSLVNSESLMLEGAPAEILVEEINQALYHVGQINGIVATEEVLGRIFSKFCVGK